MGPSLLCQAHPLNPFKELRKEGEGLVITCLFHRGNLFDPLSKYFHASIQP